MARYLVVANLTAESPSLRDEASRIVKHDPHARFVVIVPRTGISPFVALFGGLDEYELRRTREERVKRRLAATGVRDVVVHHAPQEPLDEIESVLLEGRFAAVIVSTLPRHLSRWLRTDLPGRISRLHPELPVHVVSAPRELYVDSIVR